jgi:hypothetical protein
MLAASSDGEQEWCTVASSGNIIEARWMAHSLEYWLLKKVISPAQPMETLRLVSVVVIPAKAEIQRESLAFARRGVLHLAELEHHFA